MADRIKSYEPLKTAWGEDFEVNTRLVREFVSVGDSVKNEAFFKLVGSNGVRMGDNPIVAAFLLSIAQHYLPKKAHNG